MNKRGREGERKDELKREEKMELIHGRFAWGMDERWKREGLDDGGKRATKLEIHCCLGSPRYARRAVTLYPENRWAA